MQPPKSLVDAARAGTLVPFVGAGVSVGATWPLAKEHRFPDWKGLLHALAVRLEIESKPLVAQQVRDEFATDAMAAAETAVTHLGKLAFGEEIQRLFRRMPPPRGADLTLVNAIWRLQPPFVITTNYDGVLSWSSPPGTVQAIHNDDPSYLGTLGKRSMQRRIWHLHGSADRVDTVILARSQYAHLYPQPLAAGARATTAAGDAAAAAAAGARPEVKYQNAAERLRDLLKTHTFLYVGYSLDEPLLRDLLVQVQRVTEGAAHPKYVLLRAGEADAAAIANFRDTFGVEVLEFPGFGDPLVAAVQAIVSAADLPSDGSTGAGLTAVMAPLVEALEQRVAGLAPPAVDVARLYNAARPAGWDAAVPGSDRVQQLTVAIRELGGAVMPSGGMHPLVDFAHRLAHEFVEPHKTRLREWVREALDTLLGDSATAATLLAQLDAARVAVARRGGHVLVRLAPALGESGSYRAHGWLYRDQSSEALFAADGLPVTHGDPSELVIALVEALQTRDLEASETSLAFLVPKELATAPIDQWALPHDIADDPPLGHSYLLTLCSLDRVRKHRIVRQRLRKAWSDTMARKQEAVRLVAPGAAAAAGALCGAWIDAAGACTDTLKTLVTSSDVRCVLLKDPPSPSDLSALVSVLDTTVPIVLWHRDTMTSFAEVELVVRQLLEGGPLESLRQRLRAARAAARVAGAPGVGAHLTLLWDDPDYVPPDTDPDARAALLVS